MGGCDLFLRSFSLVIEMDVCDLFLRKICTPKLSQQLDIAWDEIKKGYLRPIEAPKNIIPFRKK